MTKKSLRSLLRAAWGKRFSDWRQFALSLTRNDADAEDLVDEAVVRTLRAEPGLRSEKEVHVYILKAIRNTSIKWRRARERRYSLLAELRSQPEEYASSALQELMAAEQQAHIEGAVNEALEKMNPENREAIGLYLIEEPGLTLEAIARCQGVSTTTAHRRVQAALRILFKELQEFDQ